MQTVRENNIFNDFDVVSRFGLEVFKKRLIACSEISGISDIILNSGDFFAVKKDGKIEKDRASGILRKEDIADFLADAYMPAATAQLSQGKDIDFSHRVNKARDEKITFRVNATGVQGNAGGIGIIVTIRIVPKVPNLGDFILSDYVASNLVKFGAQGLNKGLVVLAGETASGKSTTLAAVIGEILLTENINFMSYESPIEFDFKTIEGIEEKDCSIGQSEIPKHLPDYETGVRNALRRNADLILIGESRDAETVFGVIQATIRGSKVFTTTHANSASAIFLRMAAEFDTDDRRKAMALLIENSNGIVHQDLIPKKGGGLVCLQEALFLNEKTRSEMIDLFNKSREEELPSIVNKMIEKYGLTKKAHAKILLDDGFITKQSYETITVQ